MSQAVISQYAATVELNMQNVSLLKLCANDSCISLCALLVEKERREKILTKHAF